MTYTDFWQGKNVFVTGAGGFIGSHLVETLVKSGAKVNALVRYNSNNAWGWLDTLAPEVLSQVQVFCGDVRDPGYVRKLIKGTDYGFHLAALISIPYSYDAPQSYVDTNISGTINVLQAVRDLGGEQLVCTSTSEVYGTAQFVPITEAHPLQGQSPYSASKIGADQIAESFYRSFDLPVVLLRPFNTYGPRQSMRAIIPNIMRQGMAGQTIALGNLAPTRDFNFVQDTVQGFLRAGSCKAAVGRTINIGSGREISIQDLVTKIESVIGRPLEISIQVQRLRPDKSEVFRLLADISQAQALLDYRPEVDLDAGLQQTWEWTKQQVQSSKVALYHV